MKSKTRNMVFILLLAFAIILPNMVRAQLVGPVVAVTGNVFDAVTREPVTVFLMVTDDAGERVNATRSNSAENGYYYIAGLKPGKTYHILIKASGYFKEKHELKTANTDKYEEISKDFLVKPLEKNAKIKLPVPPFELNKTKLRFGAEFLLEDFVNTLKYNPRVKFTIETYPDNNKDRGANIQLTEGRAKSLKEFFISEGIDATRIDIKGHTEVDPKFPPPARTGAKGKRYIGSSYIAVEEF